MRISYNKCDRCGKQLDPHIDWIDYYFEGKESFKFDLCDKCMQKLCRDIDDFLNPDSQEFDE